MGSISLALETRWTSKIKPGIVVADFVFFEEETGYGADDSFWKFIRYNNERYIKDQIAFEQPLSETTRLAYVLEKERNQIWQNRVKWMAGGQTEHRGSWHGTGSNCWYALHAVEEIKDRDHQGLGLFGVWPPHYERETKLILTPQTINGQGNYPHNYQPLAISRHFCWIHQTHWTFDHFHNQFATYHWRQLGLSARQAKVGLAVLDETMKFCFYNPDPMPPLSGYLEVEAEKTHSYGQVPTVTITINGMKELRIKKERGK